jgi:hypothetical protein
MRNHGPGAIVLFAAPVAWLIETSAGYALATEPCFPAERRLVAPYAPWAWTHAALYGLAVLALLIALGAFSISLRAFREHAGRAVTGRTGSQIKFAALWGIAFSAGFGVATLLTGAGLFLLPRCGG